MIEVIDGYRDMAHAGREVHMGLVEIIGVVDGKFMAMDAYETENESELFDAIHTAAKTVGEWKNNAVPSDFAAKVKALAGPQ